jgi:hypothetical protein
MRIYSGAVAPTVMGILLLATSLAGGAPAKEPPGKSGAGSENRVALLDWTAPVPRTWIAEPPKTSMRLAQFQVPGAGGADAAELVVFYFGAGQGGSAEANIARWQTQFSGPAGKPVKPRVQHFRVQGMPVTVAELSGAYARSLGMGPPAPPLPDQTLLAAVVETPRGNLTFELHGPRASVAANRVSFLAMVRGIR